MNDPIVAAVRKTRDELAAAFNYDVHAIFADLRRRETAVGDRLVRQPLTRRGERPMEAETPLTSSQVAEREPAEV